MSGVKEAELAMRVSLYIHPSNIEASPENRRSAVRFDDSHYLRSSSVFRVTPEVRSTVNIQIGGDESRGSWSV